MTRWFEMHVSNARSSTAGVLCTMVLVGCSSSSPAPTTKSATVDGGTPSPTNLRQFESLAETMGEAVRGVLPTHVPDWTTGKSAYDSAYSLWQQLKPIVLDAGVPMARVAAIDAALAAYDIDVAAQNQRSSETDANKITLTVPDVFDFFTYPAPTDTLRLDGTFRQLQIDAEYSDWASCAKDLSDTRAVWATLKPRVAIRAPMRTDLLPAATVVADVEMTLQMAQALIADDGGAVTDVTGLENQAQNGLDQTDTCEQLFK